MNILQYRKDAESFLYDIDKEYYLHFSGQKSSFNISRSYSRYGHLFGRESIDSIREIKHKSSGEEKRKAAYLLKFCTEGYMERQAKDLLDRIAEQEAQAKIDIEGKHVPFRYSEILLANEPDRARRMEIESRRNKKIAEVFNDTLRTYWETLHSQAAELGFSSYSDLFSYLKQEDFSALEAEMEKLLDETQSLYESHFESLLIRELGIHLKDSARSDFAFIKRAKKYDRFFKKESLIPVFKGTLSAMGLDIDKYKNIHLDIEERENKSPRAFCCALKVPEEIYLVIMPSGGQDDFEAMFHEGGHALHFGNTGSKLDFEYRFLGDNTITEGYAFYMEQLMKNRQWLIDFLNMSPEDAGEFVYFSSLIKLWFCRRYAGKLKYELILHDGSSIKGRDSVYRQILSSVNLIEYPEENYLKDVDGGFYCTNYIKAWIFQSQLEEYIHRKFGYNWYKKKEAGSFIRELWSCGQKYSVEEILSQLGFDKLDIDYLIDSLINEIKNFKKT